MAATQAKIGKGTTLGVGDGASPESYTNILEMVELTGTPGGVPDQVSVFNHDSPTMWDEVLTGIIRPKTINVQGNWQKAGASANTVTMALQTQMAAGTTKNFRITLPTTTPQTITFAALVVDWQVTTPVADAIRVAFSLQNTGEPTWA